MAKIVTMGSCPGCGDCGEAVCAIMHVINGANGMPMHRYDCPGCGTHYADVLWDCPDCRPNFLVEKEASAPRKVDFPSEE